MTKIVVKIDTVSSVSVIFEKQSDGWEDLNQYEQDDLVSRWVNENTEAQTALNGSTGYLLKWESE